jgi:peptide methionine sulfoxide reductase MsrB
MKPEVKQIKRNCNICQKKTDQQVKEYPDGTVYKCAVCGSKLFEPARKEK